MAGGKQQFIRGFEPRSCGCHDVINLAEWYFNNDGTVAWCLIDYAVDSDLLPGQVHGRNLARHGDGQQLRIIRHGDIARIAAHRRITEVAGLPVALHLGQLDRICRVLGYFDGQGFALPCVLLILRGVFDVYHLAYKRIVRCLVGRERQVYHLIFR